jgi:hypothetical protein
VLGQTGIGEPPDALVTEDPREEIASDPCGIPVANGEG